ncbi:hypothetical protein EDB85DRAFT_2256777, partial [Lactarius pseudohatsudake]
MYSHLPSVLSLFVAGTLGQPLITRGMPFQPSAGSFAAPLDTVRVYTREGSLACHTLPGRTRAPPSRLLAWTLRPPVLLPLWRHMETTGKGNHRRAHVLANVLLGASYRLYRHTGMDDTIRQTVAVTTRLGFPRTPWGAATTLAKVASRDLITVLSSCNGLDYTVVPALTVKNGGLCFLGGGPENATFGNDPSNPIRGEPQYPTCVDPSFATLEDPELPAP